jgi:glucosyl-3-phosphoglycerate synthase
VITVIIPALNEETTVASVVQLAKQAKNVTEIIVVDDKSMDHTVVRAREAGATVITSTKLGKGASMKNGILMASNECIVFLDADITTYQQNDYTRADGICDTRKPDVFKEESNVRYG